MLDGRPSINMVATTGEPRTGDIGRYWCGQVGRRGCAGQKLMGKGKE